VTRIAIYPGSFDPITNGHADLIRRSLQFVDRLFVAVAVNGSKAPMFTVDERLHMIREVLKGEDRAEARSFSGLLADYARASGASLVVRGLRAISDFEYEFQMALMNRQLHDGLETVFMVPAVHLTYLSSSLVREVARLGGDVSALVHPTVLKAFQQKLEKGKGKQR
jgi:pantetheine-phosphate adenylyltransferase